MKLRPPAIPLITVDPYFSVWSFSDTLYDSDTVHWTGSPNTLLGFVTVDGKKLRFMGRGDEPVIAQKSFDMGALYTEYVFVCREIRLKVTFYSSLFTDDLYRLSRPVSFMNITFDSADGLRHDVSAEISASEELYLDRKNDKEVTVRAVASLAFPCAAAGSREQNILAKAGDDLRIDWGYFYLTSPENGRVFAENKNGMTFLTSVFPLNENESSHVLFAYDDVKSLNYFGTHTEAYWKSFGKTAEQVIAEAYAEADSLLNKCRAVSAKTEEAAQGCGGECYADLLALAYRQVIAAHKLALDEDGNIIYISKECFSNGCAATVDVTYPSSPFFLLYNTELLKGMLRPIFKFALSDEWKFDFAPHDVGVYPLVTGQQYGRKNIPPESYIEYQMPVEECGNMLIMLANIAFAEGNTEFFDAYRTLIEQWVTYLEKYGTDPENQLCTDDFAGHLAHNCNLSLKAIMGIAGYALVLKMKGENEKHRCYMGIAETMAARWLAAASNKDGSFRLAFDREDSYSMKYNMIWDKLWHTQLFPPYVYNSEFCSCKRRVNAYGMPLDNRRTYTKSDWLLWTACLAATKREFEEFIEPMWKSYNVTPSRVPMSDWYDTVTSQSVGFRHRSVQGGLYIKLLETKF